MAAAALGLCAGLLMRPAPAQEAAPQPVSLAASASAPASAPAPSASAQAAWAPVTAAPAARSASGSGLQLQASPWLQEKLPAGAPQGVTTIDANHLRGQVDHEMDANGNVVVRQPGNVVKAQALHFDEPSNTVTAQGDAHINRQGNVYEGQHLQLQLDSGQGNMQDVRYQLLRNGALGTASQIELFDDQHSLGHDTIYSTCKRDDWTPTQWNPAWYVRGKRILIDTQENEAYTEGASVVFYGVPIIPLPDGTALPLSGKRQTGLLPPSVSMGGTNGLEYAQPYYFDLAPNRDATVMPTIMSKRGVDLYGQFRYLEPDYHGQLEGDYMPHDALRGRSRWRYKIAHDQNIKTGSDLLGTLGLSLHLNRVSDDDYWRDFGSLNTTGLTTNTLTDRLLSNDARLNWSHGNWSAFLFAQKYQTLQAAPPDNIVPPFDRMPQLHGRYARDNVHGFDFSLDLDYTRFHSDPSLTNYPNGSRALAVGQISYPMLRPWGFITPALQLHATHYQTDSPMTNGAAPPNTLTNGAASANRVLPTFTLDSGLVFEREAHLFGRDVTQTLEPRLFYAYTPYRDQSFLPVYDSTLKDFNLASIFSANAFAGDDRISDTNALTGGLTTRFYDHGSGAELARFTVAARRQFSARRVTLNPSDTPDQRSLSDLLLDANIAWTPKWSARASVEYDFDNGHSVRNIWGLTYSPSPYRTLSANYHFQQNTMQQVDLGWQWPLNDLWGDRGQDLGTGRGQGGGRWYSLGRVYYSLMNNPNASPVVQRGVVDATLGLEYDACCWIGRVGYRRQQTQSSPAKFSNKIMVQLELLGLSRIGSSPIPTFRDNVPRYQLLRERTLETSRFSQYD